MINRQNLSYTINYDDIPISKHLMKLINSNKLDKSNFISNGDDYQVLFTANPQKEEIIFNTSKDLGIKITKIGKINSSINNSRIINQKGKQILLKNKGYIHQF